MADLTITASAVTQGTGALKASAFLGEAATAGQAVYIAGDGLLYLASANVTALTAVVVGILLDGGAAGQPATYQYQGPCHLTGAVAGQPYVLSRNLGGICPHADLYPADYVTILGTGSAANVVTLGVRVLGVQYAPATRNLTAAQIIGTWDNPKTLHWLSQTGALIFARDGNIPLARGTTYYFSTTGSDGSGDGSQALPFATLAKAQALITAASDPADLRLRFKRGDRWTAEDQAISANRDGITIDDYGDATLARPVWNRCVYRYAASAGGWTTSSGAYYRTVTVDLAWVKYNDPDGILAFGSPLTRADSVAHCRTTDDSFFMDPGNQRLYVRAGAGIDPDLFSLEACTGVAANSYNVDLYGDYIRMENIDLVGYGVGENGSSVAVTGAANNGSGLVRITAAGHPFSTSDTAVVFGIGGTTEANGTWTVTKISSSTFDLQGSAFAHAYTSGGTARTNAGVQTYGVALRPQGATEEIVVKGCRVRYTGYHAIGHLDNGFGTVINCNGAYTRPGPAGGNTTFVSYKSTGGQEYICDGCTIDAGNLHETSLAAGRNCQGVFAHTSSSTVALFLVRNPTITPGTHSATTAAGCANPVAAPTLITDSRAFIIGETCDWYAGNVAGDTMDVIACANAHVRVNSRYTGFPNAGGTLAFGSCGVGWDINCVYFADGNASGYRSLFKVTSDGGQMWNAHLQFGGGTAGDGYGSLFSAGVGAVNHAGLKIDNSLLVCVNVGAHNQNTPNLSNSAGNINYNAYFAVDPVIAGVNTSPSGSAGVGAIGDAHKVALAAAWTALTVPASTDSIYNAGNSSNQPEYDFYGRPRGSRSSIGPVHGT